MIISLHVITEWILLNGCTHMLSAPGCQERQEMMQVEVSVGGNDDMTHADALHQNKMRNPSSICDFIPNHIFNKNGALSG